MSPRLEPYARAARRGLTFVEAALCVSVASSLLAVAVPTFVRELHASRFAEPEKGLLAISTGASTYAAGQPHATSVLLAFPRSVALTPPTPPRGHLAVDPVGTWSDPTWASLHFPTPGDGFAFDDGEPHAFAFGFDSTLSDAKSTFVAHAHADLDGDGAVSTFEVRGHEVPGDGVVLDPGMYVEAELE